jgi:AGCS family alanine or glycine:cation symporter
MMSLNLVWNVSDLMNALMTLPNLLSLILLSNVIAKETRYYLWKNNLEKSDIEE